MKIVHPGVAEIVSINILYPEPGRTGNVTFATPVLKKGTPRITKLSSVNRFGKRFSDGAGSSLVPINLSPPNIDKELNEADLNQLLTKIKITHFISTSPNARIKMVTSGKKSRVEATLFFTGNLSGFMFNSKPATKDSTASIFSNGIFLVCNCLISRRVFSTTSYKQLSITL